MTQMNTLNMRSSPSLSNDEPAHQNTQRIEQPENYILQRREILKALLNHQTESVLGVMYGHTNAPGFFPKDLDVTVIDLSATVSNIMTGRHIQRGNGRLPFADQQFDFVYCFNVIEHLKAREIEYVLQEMQRVSKKYVLISVPFNEESDESLFYCSDCRDVNDRKGRISGYSLDGFLNVLSNKSFQHSATFLPGDTVVSPKMKSSKLGFGRAYTQHYGDYCCLRCGTDITKGDALAVSAIPTSQGLNKISSQSKLWCQYGELLLLLTRVGHTPYLPTQATKLQHASLLDIDFSNFQQCMREDFIPGALWSRFSLGKGFKMDQSGISLANPTQINTTPTSIRLPVKIRAGDHLKLIVSGMKHASFSLFGVDGITGRLISLFEKTRVESKHKQLTIKIIVEWLPDSFGSTLELYLYGHLTLHRMIYQPEGTHRDDHPFLMVQPGLNIVDIKTDRTEAVFRTYYAESHGKIPTILTENNIRILKNRDKPSPNDSKAVSLNSTIKHILFARLARFFRMIKRRGLYHFRLFMNAVRVKLLQRLRSLVEVVKVRITDKLKKLFFPNDILNLKILFAYPKRWQSIENEAIPFVSDAHSNVLVLSHLFPHPDQPGVGSFVLEQLRSLQAEGVNVRVMAGRPFWFGRKRNPFRLLGECYNFFKFYRACSERWWMIEGVPVRYLPYPIIGSASLNGWCYHRAITRNKHKLRRVFKFDFIHAHTGHLDGGAARLLAAKTRCPYVITEHTGPFSTLMQQPKIRRVTLGALKSATYVTAVSEAQRKHMLSYMGDNYSNKVHVVHNSVDLSLFLKSKEWRPDSNAPRILFVGYFVPIKNISLLLEAFQTVYTQRPLATLTLVGGGENREQEQEIEEQLQLLGIKDATKMQGYTERKDVAELMSDACDMLVLSSKSESFGCVVAEALAAGKPAVVTRCGGPEDIVIADWMGRICENNNPRALAEAILSVADQLPSIDSDKIRASARMRFSSEMITKKHVSLYERLLK
ncbi:MAG: glycosyltransferase [Gammaproteobacteria bacterium]|nr:glycosyltransferase [Gammaproteobacteria bacterium]